MPHLINNGNIILTEGPQIGINNQGIVTNAGQIKINNFSSTGIVYNDGRLENLSSGSIDINQTSFSITITRSHHRVQFQNQVPIPGIDVVL